LLRTAHAQAATSYKVVPLATSGPGFGGEAYGIYNGQTVGGITGTGGVLWTDRAHYIPLGSTALPSVIYGISANQQVGVVVGGIDGNDHATLWSGTAASATRLDSNTTTSVALATDGAQQVGYTDNGAVLWTGTASSEINLNPDVLPYRYSEATGVANGVQVGWGAEENNTNHADALMWHGSKSSWTVLGIGAKALGISGNRVVGWSVQAELPGNFYDAAIWTSATPQSYVDVAPSGTTASEILATNGSVQVGDVSFLSTFAGIVDNSPGVWHGTAASFQLLPLPSGDNAGFATGIDAQGNISGYTGVRVGAVEGQFQPVIWEPTPEPSALGLLACSGITLLRRRRR
jgi:hypothetical protein